MCLLLCWVPFEQAQSTETFLWGVREEEEKLKQLMCFLHKNLRSWKAIWLKHDWKDVLWRARGWGVKEGDWLVVFLLFKVINTPNGASWPAGSPVGLGGHCSSWLRHQPWICILGWECLQSIRNLVLSYIRAALHHPGNIKWILSECKCNL